jgi:hypothetical protein
MKITSLAKRALLDILMKGEGYVRYRGDVSVRVTDHNGIITAERHVNNLVVTAGLNQAAKLLSSSADLGDAMSHMAIGEDNTSPVAGNTTLGTEVGRAALTARTWSTNTVTFTATFAAGVGTSVAPGIREAGIFNDAAAGDMLCRSIFAAVVKNAGDAMDVTWVLTVSAT